MHCRNFDKKLLFIILKRLFSKGVPKITAHFYENTNILISSTVAWRNDLLRRKNSHHFWKLNDKTYEEVRQLYHQKYWKHPPRSVDISLWTNSDEPVAWQMKNVLDYHQHLTIPSRANARQLKRAHVHN